MKKTTNEMTLTDILAIQYFTPLDSVSSYAFYDNLEYLSDFNKYAHKHNLISENQQFVEIENQSVENCFIDLDLSRLNVSTDIAEKFKNIDKSTALDTYVYLKSDDKFYKIENRVFVAAMLIQIILEFQNISTFDDYINEMYYPEFKNEINEYINYFEKN